MKICMGNDEFILYIRKQHPKCKTPNDILGGEIWTKLGELDPDAKIVEHDASSYWGKTGSSVDVIKLPKTAAQFSFDRAVLPQLYDFLDQLGQEE